MLLDQETLSELDRQTLTGCDRCILRLLSPCLEKATFDCLQCNDIHRILQQFKAVLDQESIIRLTPDGHVDFITQSARKLIDQYFNRDEANTLPASLQHWFKNQLARIADDDSENIIQPVHSSLHIEKVEKQLVIYLIFGPNKQYCLLLLSEQKLPSLSAAALELLGITRREAEVLFWMIKDKSNFEIARVLNCSEGTVRKHSENLYKKLEVQTRIGAVMAALERLGMLIA